MAPQTAVHPDPVGPTPSQTIGPFFRFGMAWMDAGDLVAPDDPDAIVLTGRVLDGAGLPVPDAMVEIWQADASGRFGTAGVGGAGWSGFGRSLTDTDGRYRFTTVVPGAAGAEAPHIDVTIFARGLLQRLVTRVYFPDQPANATDPVLASLDDARRNTLIARPGPGPADTGSLDTGSLDAGSPETGSPETRPLGTVGAAPVLVFDVHLQGDQETVFFVW